MSKSEVSKMGLGTFIGLTMALCATVRSIPTLAAVGWTLIFIQFLQFCFLPVRYQWFPVSFQRCFLKKAVLSYG
mgnify:CR=1 FL=1